MKLTLKNLFITTVKQKLTIKKQTSKLTQISLEKHILKIQTLHNFFLLINIYFKNFYRCVLYFVNTLGKSRSIELSLNDYHDRRNTITMLNIVDVILEIK